MLRRTMRAPLLRETTTDARVVLLPIRCAVTARLKGFEVVSSKRESAGKSSLRRDAARYSPATAHQLVQVLSGEVASLISGHGLQLWIPLSLDALQQNDFAIVFSDSLSALALSGIDITLELVASDILSGTSSAKRHVLAALGRKDTCIAVLAESGVVRSNIDRGSASRRIAYQRSTPVRGVVQQAHSVRLASARR